MNSIDILYRMVDNGRKGKNIGLSTGISKLDEYTGGVRKGIYTLIYGLSGSGKTAVTLYSYIYRPLKDHPDANIKIIYYSLEMSSEILLSKLLCLYIYEEYGVVIPYTSLMSWQEILSDEDYEYVKKGRAWLESISDKFIIFDKQLNNKFFYRSMMELLNDWGTFEEIDGGKRSIYIKDDPNQLVEVIIDHISLCTPIDGHTLKQEIDLISSYCVTLRERCQVSITMLQQENRNSSSMDRVKAGMTECSPDGLQDSSGPFHDCELCIGCYYPLKFKIKNHLGYPIIVEDNGLQGGGFLGLRDRYRALQIVKNRHGQSDRIIPVNFFGELGIFRELPKPTEITEYTPYIFLQSQPQKVDTKDPAQKERKELTYTF